MNLADVWDICTQFLWGDEYLEGLERFFRDHKVKRILDCAGGTGFPSIPLKQRGWDITYSDGNNGMVEFTQRKLKGIGMTLPVVHSSWHDLARHFSNEFDAILCRGNSLVYVDSWDGDQTRNDTFDHIRQALVQFYAVLRAGGVAYVDVINRNEFDLTHYPIVEKLGTKKIGGKEIELIWEFTHDPAHSLRFWKGIVVVEGIRSEIVRWSYLLRPDQLAMLLREAGFRNVREISILGERNYTVFTAEKE